MDDGKVVIQLDYIIAYAASSAPHLQMQCENVVYTPLVDIRADSSQLLETSY